MKRKAKLNKGIKRAVSILAATAIFLGSLPLLGITEKINGSDSVLAAPAADDYSKNPILYSAQNIIDYSKAYQKYPENHYDDVITINRSNDLASTTFDGFVGLGTEEYPFAGSISFNNSSSHDINIDKAFFDYVYDYVTVDGGVDPETNEPLHIVIKPVSDNSDAVFANHVLHDASADYGSEEGQKSPADWTIELSGYEGTTHSHGSVIGEMGENAECTVNLINNYSAAVENNTTSGTDVITDTGAVCGIMQSGSDLTIAKMTGSAMTSVTASSGNAGGLVGTMNPDSVLTISGSGNDYVSPTSDINAVTGYAGGLVGYNNQATVTGDYTKVKNNVSGSLGAGGIYGYYKPIMISDSCALSLDNVTIGDSHTKCTVSSSKGAGGVVGVLENPGGTITCTGGGSDPIYVNGSGNNTVFGGVIGTYKADSLDDTLVVKGDSADLTVNTEKSGNLDYYGGIIGNVDGAYFVSVSDVNINAGSADDEFFGGVVACADKGYVYANNVTLTATDYKGGAIVGHTADGVVHIAGETNLSNAAANTDSDKYGQIVGYRDGALVFAESGWVFTRGTGNYADDIGSWGEVVRFKSSGFTIDSVLDTYYDSKAETKFHYATIKAATVKSDKIELSDKSTFATAALNMQLNSGNNTAVLKFADTTDCAYDNLKLKSIRMTDSIDLSHTGMTGLTRDNGSRIEYFGAEFDGVSTDNKLTLAIGEGYEGKDVDADTAEGKGKIYRHRYNGLFGETASDFLIRNVTISGCVNTKDRVNDSKNFFVGTVAGNAGKVFSASNLIVDDNTVVDYGVFNTGNKDNVYVGGLVGKMSAPGTSTIGRTTASGTTDSTFSAKICGSAERGPVYVGGVCGYVGLGGTVHVNDIKITNEISNSETLSEQQMGGLFAVVAGGTLTLDGVKVQELTVKGKMSNGGSMGGLLGYSWVSIAATFANIKITDCEIDNSSTRGNQSAMVYKGAGYWKFNSVEIDGFALTGASANSFGILANKAYSGNDNAMYLELPSGFTYTIKNVTGTAPALYDELAVYTKLADVIEANGNSVISISTRGTTKYGAQDDTAVNMTSGDCNTYQNQVPDFNTANPNSRYYYNVDRYISQANTGAAALYLWSVYNYAHSSIKSYIAATAPDSTFSGNLSLDGYSYYPVDVAGTVNISGDVVLCNEEIEANEVASSGGEDGYVRTTLRTPQVTQHYLMHAGLFRNVSGTINIDGALGIGGTVPDEGDYCGAFICGTVRGSTSADAKITSNNTGASIALDGIKVYNKDSAYSPLLINKSGGYVVMDIYHVRANSEKYISGETIATSLIGKLGSDTAEKVQVTFSDIKLDARIDSGTLESLTAVYGTSHSLFTRATLLESLTYASGAGSFGVYNYEYSEDWTETIYEHIGNVTYGEEISSSDSVNKGKEYYYYKKFGDSEYFTNPTTDSLSAVYDFSGFLPYVAVWGTEIGTSSTKHQLAVNHSAATFSGCGTYNDPFIIAYDDMDSTNPDKSGGLLSIAKIIDDTDFTDSTFTISLPDDITTPDTWCENKDECNLYTFNGTDKFVYSFEGEQKEHSLNDVRKYLAGAYYYLSTDIEIEVNSGFNGLGNSVMDDNVFRGVIAGNGKKIKNKTQSPLIYASNGCVVKNLTIDVDNNSIALTGTKSDIFATAGGCGAYGAVIGRVFGGDNIIDQVTVDVSDVTVNPTIRTPVGGYIGVVLEGGVFFRNIDKVTEKSGFGTDGYFSEDNYNYLYCNPIIGRVISGFAVNETASDTTRNTYAPYENGERVLGDGTTTKSGNEVTIKNGNKNYSITNLDPDLTVLGVSGSEVTVPNSQAFFVISLIVNCGMGTNGSHVIGYYGDNQVTRHANYNYVGTDIEVSDYKTEGVSDEEARTAFEATDVYKDYKKTAYDTNSSPYLISQYAGSDAANLGSGSDFVITVDDDIDGIVLPDGFKGIGNIYNNDTNLRIELSTFNGSNRTISQNTTYYSYNKDTDNYLPYIADTADYRVRGLGLFNSVNNAEFKNIILTGRIVARQYNSGTLVQYTSSDNYTGLAAGGLAGVLNMNNNASVKDVYLQNIYVESTRDAGGMIGFMINNGKGITISNSADSVDSETYQSSGIYVNAGTNAAGMIARQGYWSNRGDTQSVGTGKITIDLHGHQFDFTSIKSRYNSATESESGWNANWALGVGGLVAVARANNSGSNSNNISISNVRIGSKNEKKSRIVTNEYNNGSMKKGVIYTGGMVGVFNRCPVNITNCEIYNINASSDKYSGGIVGWGGTESAITVDNCVLENVMDAKIYSASGNAGGVVGFCKNDMGTFTVMNSRIDGYTIEGNAAGGMLGDWNANSNAFTIVNSIVSSCNVKYTESGGGIAGNLQKDLRGYNVAISDIAFSSSKNVQGYIAGKRSGTIKIVGFLRCGDVSEKRLIGDKTSNDSMTDLYGDKGYVIFADYGADLSNTETVSDINFKSDESVDMPKTPYVNINPLTKIGNITYGSQTFAGNLTGDGMSLSAVESIFADYSDAEKNQRYTVAGSEIEYFSNASEKGTDFISTFKTELGDTVKDANYDFPMLIVNNTDTADEVINNYLRVLTNTDDKVDFSYKNGDEQQGELMITGSSDSTASVDYATVAIRKCNYDEGEFIISNSNADASLIFDGTTTGTFQIRKNGGKEQYDTATAGQFTLIDVAFKDPSGGKVAYHLYVPVLVKKLLEYNFDISSMSGTTYDQTLYSSRGNNVVENLGSPVTIEFEYNYLRTAEEWEAESDNDYSLDKYLEFDAQTSALFDGTSTKLVLVDVNRGGKEYYLDKWNEGYDSTSKSLDLQAFKDAEGNNFSPMTYSDMIEKQGITGNETLKEKYYLTIFTEPYERPDTEEGKNQVKVIHYSVTSSNIGDSEHPARRIDCVDQVSGSYHYVTHLVIGDFYTNKIEVLTPSDADEVMSNSNKTIIVNMSATIDLVNDGTRNLLRDYLGKTNVEIYQSMLASFDKYRESKIYDKGITAIDSYSVDSYLIKDQNGISIPITNQQIVRNSNFIEFQNNTDISGKLAEGSVSVLIEASLDFNNENTRLAQFPHKTDGTTGALTIGYSNISSSNYNTAYSVVTASDKDKNAKYYYVDTEEKVELQYYADYSGADKENQLDNQLGINAREIEYNQSKSYIQTEGRFDASELLSIEKAKYMKCSIELYQKQENGNYLPVSIDEYLDSVSVLNGKSPIYSDLDNHSYVFDIEDVEQFENESYTYKIPITFEALTGKKTNFRDTYIYANYKVKLTVSLFEKNKSDDDIPWNNPLIEPESDWVIYTNARMYTNLVTEEDN